MVYAVIMAGGIGSRFWPKSRRQHPKQFLNVLGEATLIQNTVGRLQGLIPPEQCYIVTHERYVEQTRAQLPAVPEANILAEPISRNTAPCIAFAAAQLLAKDPDATMVVLPADHVITNVAHFLNVLRTAIEKAQEPGVLVTIGITPTHPATGYGYIQFEGHLEEAEAERPVPFPVRTFAEKPDQATAERFLDSGDFLWNSGMFIWRADTIVEKIKHLLPDAYQAFAPMLADPARSSDPATITQAFEESPRISIDYGVMERAKNVFVVPGSFGWSDVGDWSAVYELSSKDDHGNALHGNTLVHNASRCLAQADGRLVVLIGVHDLIVVDTEDAVLICSRENTQQVKNVVDYLYANQLDKYV